MADGVSCVFVVTVVAIIAAAVEEVSWRQLHFIANDHRFGGACKRAHGEFRLHLGRLVDHQ